MNGNTLTRLEYLAQALYFALKRSDLAKKRYAEFEGDHAEIGNAMLKAEEEVKYARRELNDYIFTGEFM